MSARPPASTEAKPPSKKRRNQHQRLVRDVAAPWWRGPRAIGGGALVLVLLIIGAVMLFGRPSPGVVSGGPTPLPAAVLDAITKPSPSLLATVGSGGQPGNLTRLPESMTLKDSGGRPLIVYVGAEFCPFCAAERWSIAMALARFGTFSNLHEATSSPTDAYPNTSTLTFHGSSYTSQWLTFDPAELQDVNQQPLESPSAAVAHVFATVDRPPYTGASEGYPFIDIGGRFALSQTSYSPQLLAGKSWQDVATALSNPSDPLTRAIVGNANFITAAICTSTADQPASVCSEAPIPSIERALKAQTIPVATSTP